LYLPSLSLESASLVFIAVAIVGSRYLSYFVLIDVISIGASSSLGEEAAISAS
jgi:hypothetical protein